MSKPNSALETVYAAIKSNDLPAVQHYLDSGGALDFEMIELALRHAHASKKREDKIVDLLLKSPSFSPEIKNKFDQNILHLAAQVGDLEVVKFWISKKFPLDAKDNDGRTAMHHAAMNGVGQRNIIKILAVNGLNLDAADKYGMAPIHYAIKGAANARLENTSALIDNGCNVNQQNTINGRTPLMYAVETGEQYICRELYPEGNRHKLNLELLDIAGNNILHLVAANTKDKAVAEFIVKCSPDLANLPNKAGNTPLHIAANVNTASNPVYEFLANQTNKELRNADGKTAHELRSLILAELTLKSKAGPKPHVKEVFTLGKPRTDRSK